MPASNLPQNQLSSTSNANGRKQQIRQPVGISSAARPSIFSRSRPTTSVGFRHSPLSQNNLPRAAPKVSSTLVVHSSGGKKKVQGGFRSVLSHKLRRSGATEIRSQLLHKRMNELVERCSQQTTINVLETFQELTERVKQLENSLSEQKNDNFKLHSNTDDDGKENQQKSQKQQGIRSTKGAD